MRFSTLVLSATALLGAAVSGSVLPVEARDASPRSCLTDADALAFATGFGVLISNYTTAAANAILAPTFTDTSDSINFMAGIPLGTVTFPSRAAFEAGQGTQPKIPFQVITPVWHTCDTIFFRWVSKMTPNQVKGINVMKVSGGQIIENYSEFDNGAWLANLGNPQCKATA